MNANDWKRIVSSVAPALGAALGGPMAGIAVKVIADAVLGTQDASQADVEQAILGATPDQLLALKNAEYDFAARMKELDIDVFKAEVEDKGSARKLAEYNMWPHITLSALFITGYFTILYMMMAGGLIIDTSMKSEANMVLGVLTAGMANVVQFWFGSSLGSKEKTSQLGLVK